MTNLSTPRRSRRHEVPTSAMASPSGPRPSRNVAAGPSEPRPSRDVATSAVAGPSEPRPSKLPRYMFPVAGLSDPRPSGHHDVAMSEATRPSEPRPSPQHDPTKSVYPSVGRRLHTKYHQWRSRDQFESVDKSGRRRQTKTCLRCRPKRGKVCISSP